MCVYVCKAIYDVYMNRYDLFISVSISIYISLSILSVPFLEEHSMLNTAEYYTLKIYVCFELQNVTLFENRVFADVIKLRI